MLLVFWASWCHSCRGEMPHVRAAYEAYKEKGFEVLGVSLDYQTAQLQSFTAKHQMPWRQICEEKAWKSSLVQQYGLRSIPFSLLLDSDGKIVALNPQRLHLKSLLHKMLSAEKP